MKAEFAYFDLGGVVFHFSGGLSKLADKYGFQYSDFEKVFRKYDDQICRGEITPNDLWMHYQQELGFSDPNVDFVKYWVSNFSPIPETHNLMSKLVEANVPIGLLTNVYLHVYDMALASGAIPDLPYASVVKSCETRTVKPEGTIYQYAEEKSGVSAGQILFIDDKSDFLEPAKQRGWQTYQFDENNPSKSISEIENLLAA